MNVKEEIRMAAAGRKIKDSGANGATDAVTTIISLLGLRDDKVPQEKDRMALYSYVFNHMGEYSPQEFALAGTLFIKGRLDYQKELYDKLSPLFVENIMQSYARYRMNYTEPTITPYTEERKPTPEEILQLKKDLAVTQFNLYKRTRTFIDFNSPLYNYITKSQIIRLTYSQVKDVVKRSGAESDQEFTRKQNQMMTISDMRTLFQRDNKKERLREKIKYNIVKLFFDSIIGMDDRIENFINY